MANTLATAVGAALLGVNARLLAQEYRRWLNDKKSRSLARE
jgi:hypothetical protein